MEPRRFLCGIPGTELAPAHRLACFEWGDAANPNVIVCVHGLTRNARDFDYLARTLRKDYRILAPDMAGRGDSDPLPAASYAYPAYVADMAFLLGALKLPPVHWIGTSMGGIVGMMLAGAKPGALRSLALNDIGCQIPVAGLKRILDYVGVKTKFADRAEAESAMREIWKPYGITNEEHFRHLFEHSVEKLGDGSMRLRYDPAIAQNFPKAEEIKDIDLWAAWPAVKDIPVLLLRGAQSDILTRDTAQAMQAAHPKLTLKEIEKTGHAPPLMAEDQTTLIRDWLLTIR